ncbi:MAG: hypothetical protein GY796_06760 [Chloroflexi bacterium]|nr:hypothetical protein [Chloroflexota bacterium]
MMKDFAGRIILFLILVVLTAVIHPHISTAQTTNQTVYLPLILTAPISCEVAGTSYDSLSIIPPPYSGDAATNVEFSLGYRGYEPTTTSLQLIRLGPVHDVNAPQFNTIFTDNRLPTFVRAYHRYRWINDQPVDTHSPWGSTVLGMAVTPGEIIQTPDSGYDISGGYDVLVLYADPQRMTLKYTREDSVAFGYTVYIEDVCVEPDLLALYEEENGNGRHSLPALFGNQPIGRALGNEIKTAVRDTGHFLDPRSCNDWWQAYNGGC